MALLKGTQDDDLTLKYLLQNARGGGGSSGGGLPTGGTTGQVLSKKSDDDYDTEWTTPSAGSVTDVEVYGSSVVTGGVAEIPDTVHVGASAPTDAKTKIWLDTDEQGQSVVTSVNGQSGAVSLHPLFDLLWTNPSPTSTFAAQTLSIDLSDYSFLIIKSTRSNGSTFYVSSLVEVGGGTTTILGGAESGLTLVGRNVSATSTGITFSTGYLNGNSGTNTAWCIPVSIYGIRGTLA